MSAAAAGFAAATGKTEVLHYAMQILARYCHHDENELSRAFHRVLSATIRGAGSGLVLRGGLHLIGELLASISHAGRKRSRRSIPLKRALSDTIRYTAFLGSLAGVFVAVDEGIAAVLGKDKTASWRALVAGACAGPTLLLTGPKERHYSLATYVLLRGLILLVRSGNKPTAPLWLQRLLAPTRTSHGDTLAMCLACCQILYSYTMMPSTLPPSYVRFINKVADKQPHVWEAVRALAARPGHQASATAATNLLPHAHPASLSAPIPCEVLHPGQSCTAHAVSRLTHSYPRMLRVYTPVYVLPAILVHRHKLLEQPRQLGLKVALGTMRSSLFLSAFLTLGFGAACTFHNLAGHSHPSYLAVAGGVGALAVLTEKKTRRMELAVFCMARALESFSLCLLEWGCLKQEWIPPRLDVVLFSCACAALFHCYSDSCGQHRDVFRSKYLNVFDFILGNSGLQLGSIRHVPSNMDLLRTGMSRGRLGSQSGLDEACDAAAAKAQQHTNPTFEPSPEEEDMEPGEMGIEIMSDGSGGLNAVGVAE